MFDQSFNIKTLAYHLKKSDFFKYKEIRSEEVKGNVLQKADDLAKTSLLAYKLRSNALKRKVVFQLDGLSHELVFRKLNNNLEYCLKVKYSNRSDIVDNINNILSEGNPYTIYRLDVKSFYESFDIDFVKKKLDAELYLSNETKRIVFNVLNEHLSSGYSGLPRGLATSAIISEYMMKDFDLFIKRKPGVFYHARFVDDIFIVTNGEEDDVQFVNEVQKNLPKGLQLSEKKKSIKKIISKVSPYKDKSLNHIVEVDFLGYKFIVHEPKYDKNIKNSFRDVQIDISSDKIRKIKTRLVCAFKDFNDSKDFHLLVNRLRFLSSNFSVLDSERERKRLAGIFHNYHMTHAERSKSLVELDLFIKKAVLSSNGKVFSESYVSLTQVQKYRLLKFSFKRGFQNCQYVYFKADKLKEIQECWKYV